MPGLNWQKIKQKLSNTLILIFRFLKIMRFLHPNFHPEIVGDTLKNKQKTSESVLVRLLMTMKMRLKMKNRSDIYNINGTRHGHNILNIKCKMYNEG